MCNNNTKIGLVLMIGLPGSGKSTLTRSLAQSMRERCDVNIVHEVVYDALIPATVQSGSDLVSWRQAREKVMGLVKCLICNAKGDTNKNSSSKTIIIIDDNMYYRSMRYAYYQIARSYEIGFCQLYLTIALDEALNRNDNRSSPQVPAEVIIKMSSRLQPPDCIHNLWEKYSIAISSHMNTEEISHFILSSLEYVIPPIVTSQASEATKSIIHKVDLELRKIIGLMMKVEQGDKRIKGEILNQQRHQLLQKLRSKDISIPAVNLTHFLADQLTFESDDYP